MTMFDFGILEVRESGWDNGFTLRLTREVYMSIRRNGTISALRAY